MIVSFEGNVFSGMCELYSGVSLPGWTGSLPRANALLDSVFVSSPSRDTFSTLVELITERIELHKTCTDYVCLFSLDTVVNVFGRVMYNLNIISELQWTLIKNLSQPYLIRPDIVVYVSEPAPVASVNVLL